MKKTAVIGICGQSVFLNCDKIPNKGESVIANSMFIEPGGKGVNAATTIKRLGGNVSFLVSVADDEYSYKCKDFFKEENLNAKVITKHGKSDFGLIMVDSSGNNSVSVFMDENVRLNTKDVMSFEDEIKSSDYILLTGELSNELLILISNMCSQNNKIIFDPSPTRDYPIEFLKKVWLFTPNETEYENLFKLVKPNNVVITLGPNGARLIENGITTEYAGIKVDVVNTTGAGDVFNGALCYALEMEYKISDAVKFAIKAASYKVSHNYVIEGIPTLKDIETKGGE